MVQPMGILQTADLKKYYGAELNTIKALSGIVQLAGRMLRTEDGRISE
ncbi:MAG: hypothetical protein HFH42_13110 [Lachnospiraceae bacterium]|nr:hypothetical protein [Lachnospiraceae bacterium]